MMWDVQVRKLGKLVNTVTLNAPTALLALNTVEAQLKLPKVQVMLGSRPVSWTGCELCVRKV